MTGMAQAGRVATPLPFAGAPWSAQRQPVWGSEGSEVSFKIVHSCTQAYRMAVKSACDSISIAGEHSP